MVSRLIENKKINHFHKFDSDNIHIIILADPVKIGCMTFHRNNNFNLPASQ